MKREGWFFVVLSLLWSCAYSEKKASIEKETVLYAVKGTDSLFLDKYVKQGIEKPEACVFFLFGGGFVNGQRDGNGYIPYFHTLAEAGYTVLSIDYRLGMKNVGKEAFASPEQFVLQLKNTIDMAVEDLYDATSFVLGRADWRIEPSRMIISGSSAGAVAVLQAEYEIVRKSRLAQKLPEGFNYAGVIAFAGAILSYDSDLALNERTCPVMLFHGNGDSNVPYNKLELGTVGFYGSKPIADKMKQIGRPCYFYDVNNAAHEIANTPMRENTDEILIFINKLALKKQPLFIESTVEKIGATELKKDFELDDYIRTNFGN
jgi:acetyl esterase/lipase